MPLFSATPKMDFGFEVTQKRLHVRQVVGKPGYNPLIMVISLLSGAKPGLLTTQLLCTLPLQVVFLGKKDTQVGWVQVTACFASLASLARRSAASSAPKHPQVFLGPDGILANPIGGGDYPGWDFQKHCGPHVCLQSLRPTWHLKGAPFKRKLIFQLPPHSCHVSGRKDIC